MAATFGADAAPSVLQATAAAVDQVNQQIGALAAARHAPLVDLHGLTELDQAPFAFGGEAITDVYSPDFFHPNTLGQGILANTVLEALHAGYNAPLQPLRLSDQEVLAQAGIAPRRSLPLSHFDVTPYVLFAGAAAGPELAAA